MMSNIQCKSQASCGNLGGQFQITGTLENYWMILPNLPRSSDQQLPTVRLPTNAQISAVLYFLSSLWFLSCFIQRLKKSFLQVISFKL
jgi:hypothetical protein